ncbi:hypothetical protein LTS08_008754 [Lithohypha guttulata]|uniref:Uncharacterized protein n=1 Tax=Lithohypha guttulata TaxID=1690604 RepID=A0AAN7PJF1_9EURO|nr:hypothetical protein LTR05_008763 [Lithohypha guttulata]KAK5094071.1 hypothetical protein LTS08_008754 [Lithohypha guttulata]
MNERTIISLSHQLVDALERYSTQRRVACMLEVELGKAKSEQEVLKRALTRLVKYDDNKVEDYTKAVFEVTELKQSIAALLHKLKAVYIHGSIMRAQHGVSGDTMTKFVDEMLKDFAAVMAEYGLSSELVAQKETSRRLKRGFNAAEGATDTLYSRRVNRGRATPKESILKVTTNPQHLATQKSTWDTYCQQLVDSTHANEPATRVDNYVKPSSGRRDKDHSFYSGWRARAVSPEDSSRRMQSENLVESVEGRHNARGEDVGTSDEEKGNTNVDKLCLRFIR